jgi:hypothetical protein
VVNGIAAALPATLVLFYVADVLQAEAWSGAFLALYFVSGVAFLPLWVTPRAALRPCAQLDRVDAGGDWLLRLGLGSGRW